MKSNSTRPVIDAKNLTRIYALGDSEVVGINTVNLVIDAGELVVLKGDSGSGKSTLLSLLADEPTGNLDSRNGQIVVNLLAELNRKWRRTVIIATHSNLADEVASMVVHLKDGMIMDHECER